MYELSKEQARKLLHNPNKYQALRDMDDYLEDTLIPNKRVENVTFRQTILAALHLKFAMEQDESGRATELFLDMFNDLWLLIVIECQKALDRPDVYEVCITETIERIVKIAADNSTQAMEIAERMYNDEEIVLMPEECNHVTFKLMGGIKE